MKPNLFEWTLDPSISASFNDMAWFTVRHEMGLGCRLLRYEMGQRRT